MGAPTGDAPRLHEWSNWVQRQFDGPSLVADRRDEGFKPTPTMFSAVAEAIEGPEVDEIAEIRQ